MAIETARPAGPVGRETMERKNDFHLLENLTKKNSRRRLLKRGLALVSVVVLLATANVLKRNAVAMVGETFCGYDYDHVHSEECFDADGALICDLHVHTDECYEEPTPEEVEVDLSDLEGATEAVEEAEAVVPEAVPSDGTFDLAGSHQVMLSEVLAQTMLPVSRDQIEMVGLVDDSLQGDEAQGEAPVAVAMLEQDVAITALRDFSTAEIAIVTADDIYTIQLMNGAASAEIEAAAEETTEETEETAETVEETVEENTENIEEIIETTEEEPQEVAAEPAQESEITEAVEEHTEENSEANIEETVEEITAEITDGDEAETEPAETDEAVTGEVVEETVETEEADEETAETEETAEVEETEEAAAEMQAIEASEEAAEAVAEIEETEENTEAVAEIEETEENTEAVAEIEETEETTEETEEEAAEESEEATEETEEEIAEEETEEESEEKSEEEETEEEATEEETAEEESEEESTEEEATEEKTEEEETTEEESEEESEEEETSEEEAAEEEESEEESEEEETTEEESEEASEEEAAEALDIETLFPAQTFEDHAGNIRVTVTAEVGAFPAGTEMRLTPVWDQETLDGIADSVSEDFVEVKQVLAVDIAFFNAEGEEIEPLLPVSVVMTVDEIEQHQDAVVVHMDDEGNTEVVEQTETAFTEDTERALNVELPAAEDAETQMAQLVEKLEAEAAEQTEAETEPAEAEAADEPAAEAEGVEAVTEEVAIETEKAEPAEETTEVTFEADGFSLYAVVVTETIETRYIAADGATFNISVRYGEDAKIPANATLAVEELTGEATEDYLAQTEELLAEGETITLARYFDITILDAEGNAMQPQAPVSVEVKLADDPADAVQAVHFAEEGAELIDASRNDEEAVTFSAEGFSVYGIVYTVDFYYDVDGKTYEYHIKGGDVLSLKALLPILKVVEEDAAEEFVANIEDVTFSDESLLKVFRVDEDTTAGAILDALGVKLEAHARADEAVEAPEEISEEVVEEIETSIGYVDEDIEENEATIETVDEDIEKNEASDELSDEIVEEANPSAALTEEDIEAIKAKTFTAPDWALVSLQPFGSHESLTITLKNGEVVTVKVDDDVRIIDVNDRNKGTVWYGNGNTDNGAINISQWNVNGNNQWEINAGAKSGYSFVRWDVYRNYNWNTPSYSLYNAKISENQVNFSADGWVLKAVFEAPNQGGYITSNNFDWGVLQYNNIEYSRPIKSTDPINFSTTGYNYQSINAVAKPGYAFQYWLVTTSSESHVSTAYTTSSIASGAMEGAALETRKDIFTAVFCPVNKFTVKPANGGHANHGTVRSKYIDPNHKIPMDASTAAGYTGYGVPASTQDSTSHFEFEITGKPTDDAYRFAFWTYDMNGQRYGLSQIDTSTVIPYNDVIFYAYFIEKDRNLLYYKTGDSSMGTVSDPNSNGGWGTSRDTVGSTATPRDGYVFAGWYDQDGNCVSIDSTFNPAQASKSMVLTAKFMQRQNGGNVTFKVDDSTQGNVNQAAELSVSIDERGKVQQMITAAPNGNNSFIYWTLNRNGNILQLSYPNATIEPESWLTFQNGDIMTAYFSQGTWTDFDASHTAHSDIEITNEKKQELQAWLDSLKNSHTASADKTAHVYDYDNRIYQIDITAESSLMDLEADIDLAFIIDVSNSMLFPSKLVKNGQEMILTQDNLNATYPDGSTHYIISDPTGTSTAYRIFRKEDGIWYYVDASLTDDVAHKITWDCRYSEPDYNQPYKYPIYDAVGNDQRVDHLNKSLRSAIDSLHSIMNRVEDAGGTTHDIRVAHSTFAFSTAIKSPGDSTFVFNQFQSMKGNKNLSIQVHDTGGGTRQDLALKDAQQFNWDGTHKKYAILITDGAPVVGSAGSVDGHSIGQIREDIGTEAGNLTRTGVTLITVGLSTQNVLFGSNKLKEIASLDDNRHHLFFQAEHADDLESILLDILRLIMQQKTVAGEVEDVIDAAFYPVDKNGNPIAEGMYDMEGHPIGDYDMVGKPRYEWRKQGNNWVIRYHNVDFLPTWKGSVLVKAKEDFLGGNTISTNASAKVQPLWFWDSQDWHDLPDEGPINLPVPYVNVDELSLTQNDSEWTVYLGTGVNPLEELKSLYGKIDVKEVVTQTTDGANKTMTAAGDMLYPMQKSDTDGRTPKSGVTPETFPLSKVAPLSEDDWTTLIKGGTVEKQYDAYGHNNVGTIKVTLTQNVKSGEKDLKVNPHDTELVDNEVEKYTLTVSYEPKSETAPTNGWHTTPGGYRGNETGSMQSTNAHIINVFAKRLAVKKMDATLNTELKGAKFALVKTTDDSTPTVGDDSTYEVIDNLAVDSNGTVFTSKHIPKPEAGEKYFLIETQAPVGYVGLGVPVPVSLVIKDKYWAVPRVSEDYSTDPLSMPYDWIEEATLSLDTTNIGQIKRTTEAWDEDTTALTSDYANTTLYYVVLNNPGVKLPSTGGVGTGVYTAVGGALALLAIALMLRRQREN